ncbi:hypothetical protein [Hymenobacter rubripertinctus]|uniref:Uncharacterized protein n=1 Tax=Hymenobacter rubripertinctus TaxID=2029981 RepID=A0A418QIS8_9BACT|nr:hypothetical protein [Hymenobacter rubripertinctus]RIY05087.1 hypothetical protein D0T11_21050 [Hymenobacter rubripertinctus]
MKRLILLLFAIAPLLSKAQSFDFAGKEAIKVPAAASLQVRNYIETHDGIPQETINGQFAYVPIFNVLNRSQKQFVDGIYYFTWGAHDSGRLFINKSGALTMLSNNSTAEVLADYSAYLKQNSLPESTRIAYLSAIAAFLKFQQGDQKALMKSGAVLKPTSE